MYSVYTLCTKKYAVHTLATKRESYRHGNLREALLQDAISLLRTRGPDSISLRELAERAGVSPRAPYVHFPSKRALLLTIVDHGFDELRQSFVGKETDFTALGQAYIDFAIANPSLFRLMFGGIPDHPEELCNSGPAFGVLLDCVRHLHPEWDEQRLLHGALCAWAFVHGLAVLRLERLAPDPVLAGLTVSTTGGLLKSLLERAEGIQLP